MGLYAAFDLHSSNSYLGIVEENGKRTFKRRLRNEPEMIRETLRPFKTDIVGARNKVFSLSSVLPCISARLEYFMR
jgi:hypothetical protein